MEEALNKHKNKIISGIIIFIALYLSLGLMKKQNAELASLKSQKEIEAKKNVVIKNISEVEGAYKDYKDFINKKDVTTFINAFSQMATSNKIKITSVKPANEVVIQDMFVKYPHDLRLEAESYHSLAKFIGKLESHPYIFDVELLRIKSGSDPKKERSFILNVDLRVSSYILK